MIYQGACHCGKIGFEVEGEISELMDCNCSICSKRGALMWFVPRDKLQLKTAAADVATYLFNKRVIEHYFCATCGCAPFGEGTLGGQTMAAVNVRCLEDVDLSAYKINHYDGRSL